MLQARWLLVVAALVAAWPVGLPAQNRNNPMARWWEPTNDLPNPWVGHVLPLPDGREWGSTAGVDVDPTNGTVWVIDRCGSNTCVGSDLDPILLSAARGHDHEGPVHGDLDQRSDTGAVQDSTGSDPDRLGCGWR